MRRLSSVFIAGVALLVLAACSSDDVPAAAAPAIVAPTATVTPEPTAMTEEPAMAVDPAMTTDSSMDGSTMTTDPAMTTDSSMDGTAMTTDPAMTTDSAMDGSAMMTGPTVIGVGTNGTLGNILVDGEGRTLYLFTNDERNVSNCAGGCAAAWPPLHTNGDPMVLEGLDPARAGTIVREDGMSQHTYNGWPLYHFASDEQPGDANGQDRGGVWFAVSPDGGPIRTSAAVQLGENAALGSVLTDASGRTLYLFTNDERNVSNCAGGCALAWPPLLTVDAPTSVEGLSTDKVGTIDRADGSRQVTYNGWPLYYFAADEKPGDANGQNRGGIWFVVSSDGGQIRTSAIVGIVENTTFGTILVDASGRTLYLFTNDEANTSNCAGGCALAWPPLLTVDAPTAEAGVTQGLLGTITRDDGSTQVTYNGLPLYYFAADDKPGDTNGQDRGNVWFVLTPEGVAVPAQ